MDRKLLWTVLVFFLRSTLLAAMSKDGGKDVGVNLNVAHFTTSERFLCVTIDSHAMRDHWSGVNLTTPLLITLAKGFGKTTLRVGGIDQDSAIFVPSNQTIPKYRWVGQKSNSFVSSWGYTDNNMFNISEHDWDLLNNFVNTSDWELVFGLNRAITNIDGSWDSTNAEHLVNYSIANNYSLLGWELGNEPSGAMDVHSLQSMYKDFATLYKMLIDVKWPNANVIGPDTSSITGSDSLFVRFLDNTAQMEPFFHAVTYHHYYMSGPTAQESDYTDVSKLQDFVKDAWLANLVKEQLQPQAELWLGETSSGWSGGTKDLSNAFIDGFMWLDKLGVSAVQNHSKVFRQTFYGGYYALTYADYSPTPDYWLSVLYIRLVGPTVLSVSKGHHIDKNIRLYAHCAKYSTNLYAKGSVVLYMLNLKQTNATVSLNTKDLYQSSRDVYWLEPGDDNGLRSKKVKLNGQVVDMVDEALPDLPPKAEKSSQEVVIPSLSFGFVVFKDTRAPACTN